MTVLGLCFLFIFTNLFSSFNPVLARLASVARMNTARQTARQNLVVKQGMETVTDTL